jgi:predicted HTH domain antitoxin
MEMLVNIPDDIANVKSLSQDDIVLAIAIQLYVDEDISLGKAAEITGMSRFDFQKLMADKNIPLRYDIPDLQRELENVQIFLSDNSK